MAFNPLANLFAVKFKGTLPVAVFPLIGEGTTLDVQDGDDIGSGGGHNLTDAATGPLAALESGISANDHNVQANRVVEAFGTRLLRHSYTIFRKDKGGPGRWGFEARAASDTERFFASGLHVLYPGGVETVAFLFDTEFANVLKVFVSTNGRDWTNINTGFGIGLTQALGASVVFRDAIFWRREGTNQISSYDFVLGTAAGYTPTGHNTTDTGDGVFLVHLGELFYSGAGLPGSRNTLWRLDGSVFNAVIQFGTDASGASVGCMFSDGFEIMHFDQPAGSSRMKCHRVFDVLSGGSPSIVDKTTEVCAPLGATPLLVQMYPYHCIHPSPLIQDARTYLFYSEGNLNTGTLDPFRYNYRVMPTGTHTGTFILGEKVVGGTSGDEMVVTDIVTNTSLSGTDSTGVFQNPETVTGQTSGATATTSGVLNEVALTALGAGISAANFGIVASTDGGLERIFTKPAARPVFNGLPTEILGARQRPFEVNGTGSDFNVALYFSKGTVDGESSPRRRGTISGISILETPVTTGLIGNLGEVALEALSPSSGDAYVVSAIDGDASLTPGAIDIQEGDIVEYDGANWVKVASGNQPLFTDLKGYWHLDDDGIDASGEGLTLTETGSPTYAAGQFANGFNAPGSNGVYLNRTASDGGLRIGDRWLPWAVSLWVNADTLSGTTTLLDKSNGTTGTEGWELFVASDGSWTMDHLGRNSASAPAAGILTGAGSQHLLVTSDGTIWRFYLDGVEVTTDPTFSDMIPSSNGLRIGNRNDNDRPFDGVIDDVAIWQRYITPAEVAVIYNSGAGRQLQHYGFPTKKIHVKLHPTTPLIAPYTDGADENKLTVFDGLSLTGIFITTPSVGSNEVQGLTPSNGAVTYLLNHDTTADGIDTADRHSVMLDIA